MQIINLILFLIAAIAVIFGLNTASYAFHSGGVAECMGCHNIHDAKSASSLLNHTDTTSTCAGGGVACHGEQTAGSYHILTTAASMPSGSAPLQKTPGGDFGWLLKTYTWIPRGTTAETEEGHTHGHNVVAAYIPGFTVDPVNNTAPPGGGFMDPHLLSCNSCHDHHGKLRRLTDGTFVTTGAPIVSSGSYNDSPIPSAGLAVGSYRLLRGPGSSSGSGGQTFTAVFNAVSPASYNRPEEVTPTRVAYSVGISDWCATCHPDMLSATSAKHTHSTNEQLSSEVIPNYNKYRGSGNMTGKKSTSYDSIVPFQTSTGNLVDYLALKNLAVSDGSVMTGPDANDRIMCLSCHRAHASGWTHMTRWNNTGSEFIAVDAKFPGIDATGISSQAKYALGRTVAETQAAYNCSSAATWPYASYQRSLCNKCHAKD